MVRVGFGVVLLWTAGFAWFSFTPGWAPVLFLLFLFLVAAAWFSTVLVLVGIAAWGRRWPRAGLLLAALLVTPLGLFGGAQAGDMIHLLVMYPRYRAIIQADPNGRSGPVEFQWGDTALTVVDGLQLKVLVYDRTNATTAMVGQVVHDADTHCVTETERLIGRFYIKRISND